MTPHTLNRREFVAISASAAASAAISSTSVAGPPTSAPAPNIPGPTLARILPDQLNPAAARLQPASILGSPIQAPLKHPSLTITPLRCLEDRLDTGASITIEVHYPAPNLYAILYSAHNLGLGAFPSAAHINAPQNTRGQTILRITQQLGDATRSKHITLNTSNPGQYILAIPTADHSSNAGWRFTKARLDDAGQVTELTNPIPATSSRCAYFSITINEQSTGA